MKRSAIVFTLCVVFAFNESAHGDEPNPGLKSVANASTDIVVVELLDSQPIKAMEGARDTAKFKVIRALKGSLQSGDEIGVYYHLLWVDTKKWILEKPKFEKGKHYTVFLVNGGPSSRAYYLTDQWFAVLREHPELDREVAYALNEVGDLWKDNWRRQNKGTIASRRRIEILPDAKVIRSKTGMALSVKIINHSVHEITTRLAHESHGGEWPPTDLYASATHVQVKQEKSLEPVYLKGKNSDKTKLTRIAPGKSVTVVLRMDWPGTGSVPAVPLLSASLSECNVRVLLVFDAGPHDREYAASAVKFVKIVDE